MFDTRIRTDTQVYMIQTSLHSEAWASLQKNTLLTSFKDTSNINDQERKRSENEVTNGSSLCDSLHTTSTLVRSGSRSGLRARMTSNAMCTGSGGLCL